MGTRANFLVIFDNGDDELFYTNVDGYPDVLGSEIISFLDEIKDLSAKEVVGFFEEYGYDHTPWGISDNIAYYYEVFLMDGRVTAYKVDNKTGDTILITNDLNTWLNDQEEE